MKIYHSTVLMLKSIRDDFYANDETWFCPGFHAVAVYRFGVWQMQLPKILSIPAAILHTILYIFIRNVYGIELPKTARVGKRMRIAHQSGIIVHPDTIIGDNCTIRQNVTLGAATHENVHAAPKLGNNVELGAGAVVVGKVTIGDGVRIGPNAVVTMNVPEGATVVAPAARVIMVKALRAHRSATG